MSKLRVIQVGTKHDHAADATITLKLLNNDFELLGVIEENEEYRQSAMQKNAYSNLPFITYEEAFALNPDAFFIEIDEHNLVPNAVKVLNAGYPVYMDKPGSEDKESFRQMCSLARDKNLPLFLGYMYRYNPAVIYLKELIQKGELGEIVSVEAQMNCSYSNPDKRRWLGNFSGGMMFFLGCHLVDLIVSLQGFPNEVIPLNSKTGLDGIDSVDYGFCAYRYDRGISFIKTNATECNGFERRQLVVTGSKGTVEIKPLEVTVSGGCFLKKPCGRQTMGIDSNWGDNSIELNFEPEERYGRMFSEFAKILRDEKENPYSYEYEAKLHDLIIDSCR